MGWIKFRFPIWENVAECLKAEVCTTVAHSVAELEIGNEIPVFQTLFQVVGFVIVDRDEVGVAVLWPDVLSVVVRDSRKIPQNPRDWIAARQKDCAIQFSFCVWIFCRLLKNRVDELVVVPDGLDVDIEFLWIVISHKIQVV